jgi:XTP/dITP diphosphohydrolase
MTTTLVLATRNRHKVEELRRILALVEGELDIQLVGADQFPELPEVAETGSSFVANALLKARDVAQRTGQIAIADDSGLCVDALNGMPGIFSARWAGRHGDDAANLDLVLAQMADVPDARRGAAFHCAAAVVTPEGEERVVEGVLEGSIIREPRGNDGFGYDPIFTPRGYVLTTAELTPDEKNAISHRGQAFRALAPVLSYLLGAEGGS